MADEIEAFTEAAKAVKESAKLGQAVIEAGSDLAKYAGRALGTVPEDLVGLAIGDRLHIKRIENATRIFREADARLDAREVERREEINTKLIVPLLEAVSEESDTTLQDMWADLLANAMDPNHPALLQRVLIDTLKRFEPIDILVLRDFHMQSQGQNKQKVLDVNETITNLGLRESVVSISLERLIKLECVKRINIGVSGVMTRLSAIGEELLLACSPDVPS